MDTVYCPVLNRQIDGTTCIEIVDVSERMINPSIFDDYDENVIWNEEQRQKCLNCKWHADLEDPDDVGFR